MEENVSSIQVPKFNPSESYDKWRYKFMLLLEMRNCKDVIDIENRPEKIKEEEWEKKEVRAKNYIANAVDVDIIMDCKTAKDMINRLDRLYQKKSHSKQIMIEKKLCQLQYDETKSLEDFFATFERLIKKN
uniref:Retrovirus-related Pol polyprotein n=1 Tax=Anoplophora glabripennis TaxID=217634 RepID=V5H1N5_ANOGL